ncbi:hypothetical protein CR513_23363, partial [Mucuna pruriens]
MQPPLSYKEMVTMFIETLQPFFCEKMVGIRRHPGLFWPKRLSKKRKQTLSSQTRQTMELPKRPSISSQFSNQRLPLIPRLLPIIFRHHNTKHHIGPHTQPDLLSSLLRHPQLYQKLLNDALKKNPRVFTPIPVSYSELLQHLLRESLVGTVPLKLLLPPYSKNYDPNAKCDYHTRVVGHSTKKCWSLKHKVQDLVDAGLPDEWSRKGPNSNEVHPQTVNTIENDADRDKNGKNKRRIIPGTTRGLVQVKRKDDKVIVVQEEGKSNNTPRLLIVHYTLVENMPKPLELQVSVPFPYKNSKAVPWRYAVKVKAKTSSITNIAGIGGITKSRRIYAPEILRKGNPVTKKQAEASTDSGNKEKAKEKEPKKKGVSDEENTEFIKFIN